ncbi:Dyp-type peroxidase [Kitasatospora mediocidica]|uniref:Dyp-type peroxidase n=1 Tax=Kitasatospora mediocidica TaxID=58352 RepID=UPI000560D903|nr:Dyp-type peroxidase [Kitasatospora mediocidica]
MTPRPQAVLGPLTSAAVFLVLTVRPGGEQAVRELLPDLAGLRRAVGFRVPGAQLSCVLGVGSEAWDRLFGGPRPAELHPFRELAGARHTAPATPGDLLLHLRATRLDACFELATQLMKRLRGAVEVADEVQGFKFFEERDLLGFVDGTENPEGAEAGAAVLVEGEDPAFAGGSYVIVQKYLHDMASWDALPVEAQEHAVGRTKLSDIELADGVKPPDSHVALTSLESADGTERQIVRMNMPFGSPGRAEFGTYFIGYCRTPRVTEEMLENMFLGRPPGTHDRLLDFSTAVTGSLFFVPPADFLDDPPAPSPSVTVAAATAAAPAAVADGSLAIGSLRRSTAP